MEQACTGTQKAQLKFQKFELVWGKIMGYPWWPARVIDIPSQNQPQYTVEFLADPSMYDSDYAQGLPARGKAAALFVGS